MLAIICFLSGIVLSFRFEVSILIPLTLLSAGIAFASGIAGGSFAIALLDTALAIVALQGGYLIGTVSQVGVIAVRRSKYRVRSRKEMPARTGI